jgi:hypothetical protein
MDGNSDRTGSVVSVRGALRDPFEDGVGVQGVIIVLVLVAGKGTVDATADRLQVGAFAGVGGASFVE